MKILELFVDITIQIQAEKYITFHLNWSYYIKIYKHLESNSNDSHFITRMKKKVANI